MNSKEFQELDRRLKELTAQFVNFEIPIDRDPTSQELDSIKAFKLLMHAEFETFIEDRILEAITDSVAQWVNGRAISRCLFNLVLRWQDSNKDEIKPGLVYDGARLNELVRRCKKRACDEIEDNNSIKRDAFLRMCSSAGLLSEDLSGTLLANLESFGKDRGEVAHKGAGKVRSINAPGVEAKAADDIVKLLKQFDLDLAAAGPAPP